MVFSEPTFVFLFLPFVLIAYLAARGDWRNPLLLAASLVFYAWGDPAHLLVLLASIGLNYGFGLAIDNEVARGGRARGWLALGVGVNVALLVWFKYLGFILDNLGVTDAYDIAPGLPIGISFFTFQALSYLIDLQARRIEAQRSPLRLALYISMFPQLIAGPIVRYAEVERALTDRRTDKDDVAAGMQRFVTGLAKKTLIADPMGLVADRIFAIPEGGLGPDTAWLGVIAYTLQIYYDFSAYSDMAIGIGRILGFRFPENFDHPYASRSITEFWRRWHMTLSRWFRDYLYIPLGGNRRGVARTYINLGFVFLVTGIWHGAAWTFVFWGVWHGAFLVLERSFLGAWLARAPGVVARLYVLGAVMLGWVPFRADGFDQALSLWSSMLLGTVGPDAGFHPLARYFDGYVLTVMLIGAVFSAPLAPWLLGRVRQSLPTWCVIALKTGALWALFLAALVSLGAASYSPFIYFRF